MEPQADTWKSTQGYWDQPTVKVVRPDSRDFSRFSWQSGPSTQYDMQYVMSHSTPFKTFKFTQRALFGVGKQRQKRPRWSLLSLRRSRLQHPAPAPRASTFSGWVVAGGQPHPFLPARSLWPTVSTYTLAESRTWSRSGACSPVWEQCMSCRPRPQAYRLVQLPPAPPPPPDRVDGGSSPVGCATVQRVSLQLTERQWTCSARPIGASSRINDLVACHMVDCIHTS